jgi:Tol biopolymer transport system component
LPTGWTAKKEFKMTNRFIFTLGFLAIIVIGCTTNQAGVTQNSTSEESGKIVVSRRTLTEQGGRVDWCASTNLIAFDRMTSADTSEVYVIRPDGSGQQCVTCNTPRLPEGIRGQPAWHPGGEFLVIQVQGKFYKGSRFEFVSWGIHNDLWLVAADGSWAQRLVESEFLGASLHPHFSDSGDRLFWTVRESTGKKIPQRLFLKTPGRENPWDGWHLAIANFERKAGEKAMLSHRIDLYQREGGFFESHALKGEVIWFSHTKNGRPFVDDIYRARSDGTQRVNITNSPGTWEEHGELSPHGSLVTFNSSRGFDWKHPPDMAKTLRLELWARQMNTGKTIRITDFNKQSAGRGRVLTSDYAWSPSGREIAVYYATFGRGAITQAIDILRLDRNY